VLGSDGRNGRNGTWDEGDMSESFAAGIQEQSPIGSISLFPNPAADFITVKETLENPTVAVVSVSNVLGETLYAKSVPSNPEINETINVAGFTAGIYFISVKTQAGTSVRRFVKE